MYMLYIYVYTYFRQTGLRQSWNGLWLVFPGEHAGPVQDHQDQCISQLDGQTLVAGLITLLDSTATTHTSLHARPRAKV